MAGPGLEPPWLKGAASARSRMESRATGIQVRSLVSVKAQAPGPSPPVGRSLQGLPGSGAPEGSPQAPSGCWALHGSLRTPPGTPGG